MTSKGTHQIDISEIHNVTDLLRIVEDVQKTGTPCILKRDEEEIVQISPVKPAKKRRAKSGIIPKGDALTKLIGSARSAEPTDASKKYEYLAEGYLKHHMEIKPVKPAKKRPAKGGVLRFARIAARGGKHA